MNHACAIDGDALKCWGSTASGQLGNGTTINSLIPIIPTGMSAGVTSVSALSNGTTQRFTCAVVNGSAKCWGQGYYGSLGVGDLLEHDSPTQVLGFTSGVQKVTAHQDGGCLLTIAGTVHCWGQNAYSILAPGFTSYSSPFPLAQNFATTGITDLTSGGDTYACAITTAGTTRLGRPKI